MALILRGMMIYRTTLKQTFERYKVLTSITKLKYCSTTETKKESSPSEKLEIYNAPLGSDVRNVKIFALVSSIIGLVCEPYIYTKASQVDHVFAMLLSSSVFIFLVVNPILLHFLARKYVLKVHYIPSKNIYAATVYDFFARRYEIEFTPKDVKIPTVEGMLSNLSIKGRSVLIEPKLYTHRDHFVKIMSYDQPIDFKLGSVNNIEYLIPDKDKPQLEIDNENKDVKKIASRQANK